MNHLPHTSLPLRGGRPSLIRMFEVRISPGCGFHRGVDFTGSALSPLCRLVLLLMLHLAFHRLTYSGLGQYIQDTDVVLSLATLDTTRYGKGRNV